jgi:hypothetical protein
MGRKCSTCNHPERDQIELALANTRARIGGGVQQVAAKWGISRSSLRWHVDHHMTQEQVARLRLGMPDAIDANIEEIIRREGEGAILVLRDLKERFKRRADFLEEIKDLEGSRKELAELAKVSRDLILYAGLIPGRKTVTNNNLVIGDGAAIFQMVARVLNSATNIDQARMLLADEYCKIADTPPQRVLEHIL